MTEYQILNQLPFTGTKLARLRQYAFEEFHKANHPFDICKDAKGVFALEQALIYNDQLISKYLSLYADYVVEHHYDISIKVVNSLIKHYQAILEKYEKRWFKFRFKEYRETRLYLKVHEESLRTLRNKWLDAQADKQLAHLQAQHYDPIARYRLWCELRSLNYAILQKLNELRDKLNTANPSMYSKIIGEALSGYND